MINTIITCITIETFQLIRNRDMTSTLKPTCGLRQGDPISSYIFVLYLECLTHLIQLEVESGDRRPIKASRSGPKLFHLFFADDLPFFAEASTDQVEVMKSCLTKFSNASGWKINFANTLMFFSLNTVDHKAINLSNLARIPWIDNLAKYLGA